MTRLRKILPDANARFHAALDELEEELVTPHHDSVWFVLAR